MAQLLALDRLLRREDCYGARQVRTPTKNSWRAMIDRCTQPGHTKWDDYGGRGIAVCERWFSYESFVEDMGERPSLGHSINRLDNEGGYNPLNCVWSTRMEQAANKRNNVFVEAFGKRLTLSQWGRLCGVGPLNISRRLAAGWSPEDAVSTMAGSISKYRKATHCKYGHALPEVRTSSYCATCKKARNRTRIRVKQG